MMRAVPGSGHILAARLTVLLCLSSLSFLYAPAIAREFMKRDHSLVAIDPIVLAIDQEQAKAANPGSELQECSDCPVMIVLPGGRFGMGSSDNEPDREPSEGPQHEVTITKPFAVSRFEVTFAEWDSCVAAAVCLRAPDVWGRGEMPVINVSWGDAKQYTGWLSLLTGKEYRLLTETEWEYAARAGATTRYSWGSDSGDGQANCDGCSRQWLQQTTSVGSFKPNAFGLYDMQGNVWEWVEDSWHDVYDGAPTDGSAWLQGGDPSYRVVRGGAWRNDATLVRVAVRAKRNINVRFDTLGFRIARTLNP